VLAVGPKALARRDAALRQFTGFLESGRAETSLELPGITSLSLAGEVNELLYSEILHGASARLPERLPDLDVLDRPAVSRRRARRSRARARAAIDPKYLIESEPRVKALFFVNGGVYELAEVGSFRLGGMFHGFTQAFGVLWTGGRKRRDIGICAST
jgi:hypothetical protein